tara:strand:- start:625 stop:879 length:255 start_codon:yes stop_codon:yes gene_type:complete
LEIKGMSDDADLQILEDNNEEVQDREPPRDEEILAIEVANLSANIAELQGKQKEGELVIRKLILVRDSLAKSIESPQLDLELEE